MGIRGYLIDLDGTVYLGDRLIPGAREALAQLRMRGRRLVFLSNKPLASRAAYAEKLERLGIEAQASDIIHSSYVMARYLAKRAPGAKVFAIGEPPLIRELCEAGLYPCNDPEAIEYVIAAFDRTFNYEKLNIAFQAIRRGAHFVATNPDPTCPVEGGEIPDAAAVIAALEATTGKRVEAVVGKPSIHTAQVALEHLGLTADETAMVGDRLATDIALAKKAGMLGILTLSGVTTPEALSTAEPRPDHVIESIAQLPELDLELAEKSIPPGAP